MTNLSRRSFLAGSAFAATAVLAGCATGNTTSDDAPAAAGDDKSAAATGKLVVGFDASYPPYGYMADDGSYTGFDLDLAAEVATRNSWEIQLEPIDWDAKNTLLDSGAINCIWNGFTMEGRENDYTFSEAYMLNAQVVVAKSGAGISSLDDLAGKNVITQVDSAAYDVLSGDQAALAATFASLETIGDYNTAFMQLETGAVDAVACDLSIAAYQMSAKPNVYVQVDELSAEHYAVGLKKGDTATADAINAALKDMDADGTVKTICDKYADQGIDYANWCLK